MRRKTPNEADAPVKALASELTEPVAQAPAAALTAHPGFAFLDLASLWPTRGLFMRALLPRPVPLAVGLFLGGPLRAVAEEALGIEEPMAAVKTEPDPVCQIKVEQPRRGLKAVGIVRVAALHDDPWRRVGGRHAARWGLRYDAERTLFDAETHKGRGSARRSTICSAMGRPPEPGTPIVRRRRP